MESKHEERLRKAIKKHEVEEAAKEKKIRQEELEYKKKINDFEDREKELYLEKLVIAEEIMKWVKEFNQKFDFKEVIISYGGGGHKFPRYGGGGCWSRIYFQRSNKLRYWAGYKWMPTGPTIIFENEKELAEKLTHEYLKSLHEAITTGKVYETIRKGLS